MSPVDRLPDIAHIDGDAEGTTAERRRLGSVRTAISPQDLRWCKAWGLQEADAEDVAQDVLTKLTQKMASFGTISRAVSEPG